MSSPPTDLGFEFLRFFTAFFVQHGDKVLDVLVLGFVLGQTFVFRPSVPFRFADKVHHTWTSGRVVAILGLLEQAVELEGQSWYELVRVRLSMMTARVEEVGDVSGSRWIGHQDWAGGGGGVWAPRCVREYTVLHLLH